MPLIITTTQAKESASTRGLYFTESKCQEETIRWLEEAESTAREEDTCNMEDIAQQLRVGDHFGPQCHEIRCKSPVSHIYCADNCVATPQGLRQGLKINGFPISAPDAAFRGLCQEAKASHLYGSYITIGTAGSILTARTSFANTTVVYFHHRGAPRKWIVIPPVAKQKFEEKMRAVNEERSDLCSQFVRHMKLWIEPLVLKEWGIQFIEFVQNPQELIFFCPDTYFYGFSEGLSIVESKLHAGPRWGKDNDGYKYCDGDSACCQADNIMADLTAKTTAGPSTKKASSGSRGRKRIPSVSPCPAQEERRPQKVQRVEDGIEEYQSEDRPLPSGEVASAKHTGAQSSMPDDVPIETTPAILPVNKMNATPFDISDDEENVPVEVASANERILLLQQENGTLIRNLAILQSERDVLKSRKNTYKSHLLEREALILELEQRVKNLEHQVQNLEQRLVTDVEMAGQKSWADMLLFVQGKLAE